MLNFITGVIRPLAFWFLLSCLFMGPARAEDSPSPERQSFPVKFGGDIRIRQIYFDNVPYYKDVHLNATDYFRFRTRLWAEVKPAKDVSFRARVANEFRQYLEPSDNTSYRFPDEIFIDQLYMDVRNLWNDNLDIRIGRQSLRYGTGKIIANGTPKSSARTDYFDAVKLTWKGIKDTEIDVLGIYDRPTNQLVINSQGRDLTGYPASRTWMTETGAGVYLKNRSFTAMPFEAYNIFKRESPWDYDAEDPTFSMTRYQTLDSDTERIQSPALSYNTMGLRIMPKFTDALEGSLEGAYQFGHYAGGIPKTGYMTDLALKWKMPLMHQVNPVLGAGWYYLSGTDPDARRDGGWVSPFARTAGYSSIYTTSLSYEDAARWTNMSMYYVDLTITPCEWLKAGVTVGYLLAPVKDGLGDGNVRGWLAALQADFRLGKALLRKNDTLTGHLRFETLKPGDYYLDKDLAYYARWEVVYAY